MQISIIGLGLIGGSIARAAKKHYGSDITIVGLDADSKVCQEASEIGVIDRIASDLSDSPRGSTIVILAVPIRTLGKIIQSIAPSLDAGAIVTDVSSVKLPVCEIAHAFLPASATFVGGHPMAGSEHRGFASSEPYLFENAVWVLTSDEAPRAFEAANPLLVEFVKALGARIVVMPADEHDELAARTSHLPQLLAVNLMQVASSNTPAFGELAAGGFRDMTRIASSSFEIWRDILASNHTNILDALADMASAIQQTRNRIIEEDYTEIEKQFEAAAQSRQHIPSRGKGFLYPLADLYVGLIDEPGALKTLTHSLFENDINIKDIELLKLREGTGGTFRLSFDSQGEADSAHKILAALGYSVHGM